MVKQAFYSLFSGVLLMAFLGHGAPAGYGVTNLLWSDEFNGVSSNVDLTKWKFDIGNVSSISGGGWGNNERQFYTSRTNNAYVSGGLLHIVAKQKTQIPVEAHFTTPPLD